MPPGNDEGNEDPTAAYDVEAWVQSMEEDASKEEVRRVMQLIAGLSKGALVLSTWAEVEGGTKGKENHDSWETLLVVHPLLGVGVLIGETITAPGIQPKQELWEMVIDQHGQEEVLGWRLICWCLRMKRPRM